MKITSTTLPTAPVDASSGTPTPPRASFGQLPIELAQQVVRTAGPHAAVALRRTARFTRAVVDADPVMRAAIDVRRQAVIENIMGEHWLQARPGSERRLRSAVQSASEAEVDELARTTIGQLAAGASISRDAHPYHQRAAARNAGALLASERPSPRQATALVDTLDRPAYRRDIDRERSKSRWKQDWRSELMTTTLEAMLAADAPAQAYAPVLARLDARKPWRRLLNPFAVARYAPLNIAHGTLQRFPAPVREALKPKVL